MMQKRYRFFFLLVLIFTVSCDEISDGGENVVDDGGPTIVEFSATPPQINPGGSATLSWDVDDATSITIDNGVGDVTSDADAQFTVNPAQTTTYTLTASDGSRSAAEETTVTVTGDTGGGDDTAAPTGDFGLSDSQSGPFQNDKPNDITGPDDERIVTVAPGGTFYAQVDYSDPSGVTDIAINLVSSNPPDIAGELDPTQQFFTLGDPVGGCPLSSTQTDVTCVYPITVSDDAVNITELPNSANEFAYVFRTLVTDSAGNQSMEFIRGYVIVDGDGGGNPPNPPTPNPPAAPSISSFTAESETVQAGQEFELSWQVSGEVDVLTLTDTNRNESADVTGTSEKTVSIQETTVFTLTATNSGGEDVEEFEVAVGSASDVTVSVRPLSATLRQGGTVPLEATVSNTDNTAVTWTVAEGGGSVSDPNANQVTYRAPSMSGVYTVTATSVVNPSKSDSIDITVSQAPTAVIGEVQPVSLNDTVTLDGSASSDPDNGETESLTYSWTLTAPGESDATDQLTDEDTVSPSFEATSGGTYTATLVVTDENGIESAPDTVEIEVGENPPPTGGSGTGGSI